MYYTYMLRCEDNSVYTGMTSDIKRRLDEHLLKDKKCAKYTLRHNAIKLEALFESENRITASKLEYRVKHLSKKEKEQLILDNNLIENLLGDKIDVSQYKSISIDSLFLK